MSRRRIKHRIKGEQVAQSETFVGFAGKFGVFASESGLADMGDFALYMEAHKMMPYYYSYEEATCSEDVGWSIRILRDAAARREEQLRAIAILGHSPCAAAISALAAYVDEGGHYFGVASLALSECSGMFGQGYGGGIAV